MDIIKSNTISKCHYLLQETPKNYPDMLENIKVKWLYCKRGYFRWGKIMQKGCQDLSRGGNFHDTTPISLIKSYGLNFRAGEIFVKKAISWKPRKLPPRKFPRLQYSWNIVMTMTFYLKSLVSSSYLK